MFPQNGDLQKQFHERQPRVAALSDKQVSELACAHPRLGGEEGRGVLWRHPKKCRPQRSALRLPKESVRHPRSYPGPLFWKERAGFSEAEGEGAVAERRGLHLKGGEQPASILRW